jgi:hypothetical protein
MWPYTPALLNLLLTPSVQANLVGRHAAVLRTHNPAAFAQVMAARTVEAVYALLIAHFGGYGSASEAESKTNGFLGGNQRLCASLRTRFLHVATDDDPVSPGGPRPDWMDNYATGSHTAAAVFPHGSHLACYDSLDLRVRWIDRLVVEWIDAIEAQSAQKASTQ